MTKYFLWEWAPSPHLGNILDGLASMGADVEYLVGNEAYRHRQDQGWPLPNWSSVPISVLGDRAAISDLIENSHPSDVHICAGLRANRFIKNVVAELRKRRRTFFVFLETIDERTILRHIKRPMYRFGFFRNRSSIEGVLAAGLSTGSWVSKRGVPSAKIFDFGYFLSGQNLKIDSLQRDDQFRLLFVGSLIERKRVDLILDALPALPGSVRLDIVGDGPLREALEDKAEAHSAGRVTFHGTKEMKEIPEFLLGSDCLVLPSTHDGWGAVISEAMILGTPVVCSNGCGASIVVQASGFGRVFEKDSLEGLQVALMEQIREGPVTSQKRARLASWSNCLTAGAGASYLSDIVQFLRVGGSRPLSPWQRTGSL